MLFLNLFKHNRNIKTFSAGEIIFRMGDYGDEMYVVQEGEVAICLGEQVIEVVESNGILGEMVMISSPTRTATALAISDCQLVTVKSEQFRFMVQETPYFAEFVLGIFVGRLMKMNQMLFPAEFSLFGKGS
jgi:CRP-like cAMP-binding protein